MDALNKLPPMVLILFAALLLAACWYFLSRQGFEFSNSDTSAPIFVVATSTGTVYFTVTADGKVGIGSENPTSMLEVAGQIRLTQKSTDGCSPATEGAIAYNPDNGHFWGCNGRSWNALDN